jgi:hypothetical protein
MARFPFPWLLACRGWQLFANHPSMETMSFATGFDLILGVVRMACFGSVKHSSHRLCGSTICSCGEDTPLRPTQIPTACQRNAEKSIDVAREDSGANEIYCYLK